MAITVPSDFLALVRRELADTVEPYLWSDVDLYQYMNEAEREFARETKCITDSVTYTDIDIAASEEYVDIDPEIIDIKRAVLTTSESILTPITVEEFSDQYWVDDYGKRKKGYWEDDTGTPKYLITNYNEDQARFYPIPDTADVLDLTVWREPTSDLGSSSVAFQIPKRFIYRLIYKIKFFAYSKQDFETFDGDKRAENLILWEKELADAQSKMKKKIRRPRGIVYGGI